MLTGDSGTVKDAMLEEEGIVAVSEVEAMAMRRKGEPRHVH